MSHIWGMNDFDETDSKWVSVKILTYHKNHAAKFIGFGKPYTSINQLVDKAIREHLEKLEQTQEIEH